MKIDLLEYLHTYIHRFTSINLQQLIQKMPFISKDWRSPGEVWVKTEEGWEKLKVLECGKRKR